MPFARGAAFDRFVDGGRFPASFPLFQRIVALFS
jgi:hypothetical protein